MREDKVSGREIARHLDIPEKVLASVLLQLRQAKFIRSIRGKQGGYFLDKNPNDITLYDIVRLIDGEPGDYEHLFSSSSSNTSVNAVQVIKSALENVNHKTMVTMKAITLRELTTSFTKLVKDDQSYSI